MRYLLFGGECYYALGGGFDLLGAGNSIDDLLNSEALNGNNIDWYHVFDTETREIVAQSEARAHY